MPTCASCGAANAEDARFCMMCGASLPSPVPPPTPVAPPSPGAPQPATSPPPSPPPAAVAPPPGPRRERRTDLFGPIGFGVFLVTLGIVLAANPALPGELGQWLAQIGHQGPFHRPPDGVIGSASLLFAIGGVSGLFLAGLRYVVERRRWRAFTDAMGAIGSIGFSALLYLYAGRSISGTAVIGGAVVLAGILIIASVLVGMSRSARWGNPFRPEPPW